jgi:hypothetical protein
MARDPWIPQVWTEPDRTHVDVRGPSAILPSMFALASVPHEQMQIAWGAAAGLAAPLAALAACWPEAAPGALAQHLQALMAGATAPALHLRSMRGVLDSGRRGDLMGGLRQAAGDAAPVAAARAPPQRRS